MFIFDNIGIISRELFRSEVKGKESWQVTFKVWVEARALNFGFKTRLYIKTFVDTFPPGCASRCRCKHM